MNALIFIIIYDLISAGVGYECGEYGDEWVLSSF